MNIVEQFEELRQGRLLSEVEFEDIVRQLSARPENISIRNASTTLLYSGRFSEGNEVWRSAKDLADRSRGRVGVLDNTPLGEFLQGRTDAGNPIDNFLRDGVNLDRVERKAFDIASEQLVNNGARNFTTFVVNPTDESTFTRVEAAALQLSVVI